MARLLKFTCKAVRRGQFRKGDSFTVPSNDPRVAKLRAEGGWAVTDVGGYSAPAVASQAPTVAAVVAVEGAFSTVAQHLEDAARIVDGLDDDEKKTFGRLLITNRPGISGRLQRILLPHVVDYAEAERAAAVAELAAVDPVAADSLLGRDDIPAELEAPAAELEPATPAADPAADAAAEAEADRALALAELREALAGDAFEFSVSQLLTLAARAGLSAEKQRKRDDTIAHLRTLLPQE